jgi:hypothetical protein
VPRKVRRPPARWKRQRLIGGEDATGEAPDHLCDDRRRLARGALNLFSRTTGGFTSLDIDHGLALAAQIALAFQASESQRNFDAGLANRTVTGQAVGMVMERYSGNLP